MKLSINTSIINKNETKQKNQAKGFVAMDLSAQELLDYIAQGCAFSYQFDQNYRKTQYFRCSDIIVADFDHGMTWGEALAEPFFNTHACLAYTTASHTPEAHRLRVVFQAPYTITDSEQLRAAQRGLVRRFRADPAATDPGRQFYGSLDCQSHTFGQQLSQAEFDHLLALGMEPVNLKDHAAAKVPAGSRASVHIAFDTLITLAEGGTLPLRDIAPSTAVFCPFHNDQMPSAFTTRSRTGTPGVHCCTCQLTFWPKHYQPVPYDFLQFDKQAEHLAAQPPEVSSDEPGGFETPIPNYHQVFSKRYLPVDDIPDVDGIALIKSPKGSGKTQYLEQLLEKFRSQRKTVLLIGHRRSLIRALSNRLKMECYLDLEGFMWDWRNRDRFAVSVDSISTCLSPWMHKFDVVLIDESEQVFSHLIAETMDKDRRHQCYLVMRFYIEYARHVIALDADLNHVTMYAIQRFHEKKPFKDRRLILNKPIPSSRELELFKDKDHLLGCMFDDIAAGKRLFVCANSKKLIEELRDSIQLKHGNNFPLFWITSENSGDTHSLYFIENIQSEILKYQVVLVSPTVGTGIDITFPGNASLIDGVYGFFGTLINTHYDIDQQLSRVRHPGFVRAWIAPQTYNFETEVEPIQQELAESGTYPHIMNGFTPKGRPIYNWTDSLVLLHSHILASQRASKNRLRKHFIELREYNGWAVQEIAKNDALAGAGSVQILKGKEKRKADYCAALLSSAPLTYEKAQYLIREREAERPISGADTISLDRYFIEAFYKQPLTAELIALDNEGYYRRHVSALEHLLSDDYDRQKELDFNIASDLYRTLFDLAGLFDQRGRLNTKAVITIAKLHQFVQFCTKHKHTIERVLEIDIHRDLQLKPVKQLNRFLEDHGQKLIQAGVHTIGGKKIYEYSLCASRLQQALDILDIRQKSKNS